MPRYAAPVNLGPTELIILLVIVLVLFGGAKLPKLARSLGQAKKEFEHGINEGDAQAANHTTRDHRPPAS